MSDVDRYRLSFDRSAEAYERSRPTYAPEAIAWLEERVPLRRVLDLGAGTGKLTRQLAATGADVVAVEPGDEMRAVLQRVLPQVEALAGSAEAIPLPDGSVDAVTAGQSFHWFKLDRALPEIHRVLRPGGGIALLWNDSGEGHALGEALGKVITSLRPGHSYDDDPEWKRLLEASPLFGAVEERRFGSFERLPPELVIERLTSISAFITADRAEQERALAEVRALVGDEDVELPMITKVFVADRV